MPAGVAVIKQEGKTVLAGNLSYFRISTVLCSLCQEMEPRWQVGHGLSKRKPNIWPKSLVSGYKSKRISWLGLSSNSD